jgi:phosphotriesterase-related protein
LSERSRTDISGPTVMTVLGPVSAAALGKVLVHEHLKITLPGTSLDPRARQSRRELIHRATDRLCELREYGVGTFVDPCPIELGRDVELMAEVSALSGVSIVCSTGFYNETEGIGIPYYWRMRWPEEICELYLEEIERGIDSTGIRPGVVKAATGVEVGRHERKVLAGAARAAMASGLAIITHTTNSRCGAEQQALLGGNGMDLSRCLIGHQDEIEDSEDSIAIARRGSFVGIDRVGYESLVTDARRIELVRQLVAAGQAERLCLSQDHLCVHSYGRPGFWIPQARAEKIKRELLPVLSTQGYGRSSAYIFSSFVPRLIDAGVDEATVDAIFTDNPRRLLCGSMA